MKNSKDITLLENKLKELNHIWVDYLFSFPYFFGKIKFTDEEKTNYIGVIFGYFRDSFDVVFTSPPDEFISYVDKFTYQIALLQSIYVQQDLTEELLRIFKTGIERNTLNSDLNFSINRGIRNELIGHPISRNKDFSLRSSTVFGYEKSGNSIHYLRYKFPNETNVVQVVELKDIIIRHKEFLICYLDKLLEKSYCLLNLFKVEVIEVLGRLLKNGNEEIVIRFCETHFKDDFESKNELKLNQIIELKNNKSHPRYEYTFNLYWESITDFFKDTTNGLNDILSKKNLTPKTYSNEDRPDIFSKIKFVNRNSDSSTSTPFKRTDYNYELGKLYSKRNINDFEHFSYSILQENEGEPLINEEIEQMKMNLNNNLEFNCSWNYLNYLLNTKFDKINKEQS
jgi:hypothetical protein